MYASLHELVLRSPNPLILAGGILIVGLLVTRVAFRTSLVRQFLCQFAAIAGCTILLWAADVTSFRPTPAMDLTLMPVLASVFKILWWLAATWLAAGFVKAILGFKQQPKDTRLLQGLCAGLIYVGAALGIVAYVFDLPISGVLAASGVIPIVLGLALQSTLGDVFSGIALNLARPYHPGNWVILDHGLEGCIVETNWRATQILTQADDLAAVPNSPMAKARLVNASRPTQAHGTTISVRLDPSATPASAVSVLETARFSCTQISHVTASSATIQSLDAVAG